MKRRQKCPSVKTVARDRNGSRFDSLQTDDKSRLVWPRWKNNEYLGSTSCGIRRGTKTEKQGSRRGHNSVSGLRRFDENFVSIFQGSFPTKRKRFPPPPPSPPPAAAPVQVACLFWKLRTVAFQTTAAAISTLHPGNRQYLVCVLPPPTVPRHPSDAGRVKEHPFGVCDACRWPCRGKSRVAALNCTVAPNTCPTAGPNVRPTNTN